MGSRDLRHDHRDTRGSLAWLALSGWWSALRPIQRWRQRPAERATTLNTGAEDLVLSDRGYFPDGRGQALLDAVSDQVAFRLGEGGLDWFGARRS